MGQQTAPSVMITYAEGSLVVSRDQRKMLRENVCAVVEREWKCSLGKKVPEHVDVSAFAVKNFTAPANATVKVTTRDFPEEMDMTLRAALVPAVADALSQTVVAA